MKKVVSATLAGALAVGMVPAMALADDSVELMTTADLAEDIANGKITAASDELDNKLDLGSAIAFEASSDSDYVVPTEIVTKTGTVIDLVADKSDYTFAYYQVKTDGTGAALAWSGKDKVASIAAGSISAPGAYYVAVRPNTEADEEIAAALKFTITAESLAGAYIFNDADNDGDLDATEGTEFEYANKSLNLGLTFGKANDLNEGTDFNFTYFAKQANGKYATIAAGDVKAAGEYAVKIVGGGDYAGYAETRYFAVEKLDLADAELEFVPGTLYAKASASEYADDITVSAKLADINNGASLGSAQLELVFAGDFPDSTKLVPGKYSYTLAPTVAAGKQVDPNIEGTQEVTVIRYEKDAVIKYAGGTDFDLTDGTPSAKFDPAALTVTDGATEPADVAYTVTYKKLVNGKYAEVSSYSAPGTYQAVVAVNDGTYEFGGQQVIDFKVAATVLDEEASVFVTYKGALETGNIGNVYYTGEDVLEDVVVSVIDNKKNELVEGVDYVVSVVNDKAPKVEVDSVVEVGDYTLTVKPAEGSKYEFANAVTVAIKVVKAPVFPGIADQVATQGSLYTGDEVLYTGEEIDPILGWTAKFDVNEDGVDYDAKDVMAVPTDQYKVVITSFVDPKGVKATASNMPEVIKEAGTYTFQIVPTKECVNFDLDVDPSYTFVVTAANVFPDVAADAWYADEVLTVAQEGWITGYGNGMFGPNDGMKRGDLAVVLARYIGEADLGAWLGTTLEGIIIGDALVSIDTGFSDVKGGAYYAKAIKAMAEAGIMTGYDDGTYGPEDLVTRQQLATILARLDASGIGDASILASALDAYADADEVAGWAAAGVEWAVENEIMGVNTAFLNPTDAVSRAEVAAMLLRYDAIEA